MSYENPTALELALSEKMQKLAHRMQKILDREFGKDTVWFMLQLTPKEERDPNSPLSELPISSFVSNQARESSAEIMVELLLKWAANNECVPIHHLIEKKAAEARTHPPSPMDGDIEEEDEDDETLSDEVLDIIAGIRGPETHAACQESIANLLSIDPEAEVALETWIQTVMIDQVLLACAKATGTPDDLTDVDSFSQVIEESKKQFKEFYGDNEPLMAHINEHATLTDEELNRIAEAVIHKSDSAKETHH